MTPPLPSGPLPDPTIGVVIGMYNGAAYIGPTIESVISQTRPDWRLVVVDDGSTDDGPEIVAGYVADDPRVSLVRQPNQGVSVARNTGVDAMDPTIDRLVFLDADDLLVDDALDAFCRALDAHPDAPAAHGLMTPIDQHGAPLPSDAYPFFFDRRRVNGLRLRRLGDGEPTDLAVLSYICCIAPPAAVGVRRSSFERAGRFDSKVRYSADWDMWLRLALLGDLVFIDKAVVRYRMHPQSMSTNATNMRLDERLVRSKLVQHATTRPARRQLWLGWMHYEARNSARKLSYAWHHLRRRRLRDALLELKRAASAMAYAARAALFVVVARGS